MDIRKLEAFCKVYETRSFSQAGKELFLSQPTISSHVAGLENELGVRLFDRVGRVVMPSQAGTVLYEHVHAILRDLEKAKAHIHLLASRVTGTLCVGASTIPAAYLLPSLLREFREKHPDVEVEIREGDSRDITTQVLQGKLSLGVVGGKRETDDLEFVPLLQEELVLVTSRKMQVGEELDTLDALQTLSWVNRAPGSGTRRAVELSLERVGVDVKKLRAAVTVKSTNVVLQCVQEGFGVSFVSPLAARQGISCGALREVSVPGLRIDRTFYLVYHRMRDMLPVVEEFVSYARGQVSLQELPRNG